MIALGVAPNGFNINRGVRLDPHRRRQPPRSGASAPTSASRSTATPTGVMICRREGPGRRRRPDHGADRRRAGPRAGRSQGRRRRRHGDVQPRPRALPRRARASRCRAPPVGDRYVVEAMREGGFNLGGEQSGHIILRDFATTGDGLIAALQVLAAMVETGKPTSALARVFEPVPQMLRTSASARRQAAGERRASRPPSPTPRRASTAAAASWSAPPAPSR